VLLQAREMAKPGADLAFRRRTKSRGDVWAAFDAPCRRNGDCRSTRAATPIGIATA
jgi:hypothetical protein